MSEANSNSSSLSIGTDLPDPHDDRQIAFEMRLTALQDMMERLMTALPRTFLHPGDDPPAAVAVLEETGEPTVPPTATAIPPITIDARLDQNTKTGNAHWKSATEALENKYSGAPKETHAFLTGVRLRCDRFGWNRYFTFNVNGINRNLLKDYGNIPINLIKARHENRKIEATRTSAAANEAAETKMIFYFLYDSLAANMQRKLSTRLDGMDYDGATLLATILSLTYVSSIEATENLRETMTSLHLKKYKWNVKTMNQAIRETIAQLEAVGHVETHSTQQFQIFRGYKTATNKEFLTFLHLTQHECAEGRITSIEDLMARTDAKYDAMVREGTWKKDVPQEKPEITALTATVKPGATTSDNKSNPKPPANKHPDWKFDRSLSTTTTLTRGTNTYNWCDGKGEKNHKPMWVVHKPADCKGSTKGKGTKNPAGNNNNNSKQDAKSVLTAAMSQLALPPGRDAQDCVEAFLAVLNA